MEMVPMKCLAWSCYPGVTAACNNVLGTTCYLVALLLCDSWAGKAQLISVLVMAFFLPNATLNIVTDI